jgi:hypothetical protein
MLPEFGGEKTKGKNFKLVYKKIFQFGMLNLIYGFVQCSLLEN